MAVLLLAGVLKLFDLPAFASSLSSWSYLPDGVRVVLVILVPIAEVAAPGLFFAGVRQNWACRLGLTLLVGFTLVYVGHLALGEAPECRCFGKLSAYAQSVDHAWIVVARNIVLMLMILPGALPARQRAPRHTPTGGFTLIETLLVMAIVGLLLALLLPSLTGVRDSATRLVHLSRLRQHASVFTAYTMDWDDTFPAPTDPDATYTVFYHNDKVIPLGYFDVDWRWNVALASEYDDNPLHPSFFAPKEARWYGTDYNYSVSFLADPKFWNPKTRTGPRQWRSTRINEVRYPSLKGMFVNRHDYPSTVEPDEPPPFEFIGAGAAFVDGSAEFVKKERFGRTYIGGEGPWPARLHPSVGLGSWWVSHTVDGVRGRDVETR